MNDLSTNVPDGEDVTQMNFGQRMEFAIDMALKNGEFGNIPSILATCKTMALYTQYDSLDEVGFTFRDGSTLVDTGRFGRWVAGFAEIGYEPPRRPERQVLVVGGSMKFLNGVQQVPKEGTNHLFRAMSIDTINPVNQSDAMRVVWDDGTSESPQDL